MNDEEPQSPCISVCLLDDKDICVGCYRSAAEITEWFMSSTQDKCEILRRAKQRMDDAGTIRFS